MELINNCLVPDITELNRLEIQEDLSEKLNSMNITLESTLKEHSKLEKEMQSDIDSVRVEKAKLDQEIKIKEKQIIENSSEIDVLKKDIEQVIYIIEYILNMLVSIICFIFYIKR